MNEWNVVTVIVVLMGLLGTVAAPLIKNTKAMTQLSGEIKNLIFRIEQNEKETDDLKVKASNRHKQMFEQLNAHENKIINHEDRISVLEHKEGQKNEN